VIVSRWRTVVIAALVGVTLVCPSLPVAAGKPVSNAKIRAAREKAAQAQERLDDIAADLEVVTEDLLAAESDLQVTRREITLTEEQLRVSEADLAASRARLTQRVGSMYRKGDFGYLDVILGVTSFRDLVIRLDLMRRVGSSDAALVAEVKRGKTQLEQTSSALERRNEEQVLLREKAREARQRVDEALTTQKEYLASLGRKIKSLVAQERERREREARAAAARAAAGSTYPPGREFDPKALGESHDEVIGVARRYVGHTPYRWGGTTPAGFDCSGLTQFCYREKGIVIPRTSRQQFRVGAYIPPSRLDLLRPGDLVFFGRDGDPSRVHHVAIFIGDGDMIHAPQTGELVSVSSLTGRIASRGDYVGAVRP
jgi:cell wall-associated NlpC family hydrolase